MDLKYLKSICECYYTDHIDIQSLYSNKTEFVNDIFEEMKTVFSTCRIEDKNVDFDFTFNHDKVDQQKIVYSLIEMSLHDRFPSNIKLYYDDEDYVTMYDSIIISEIGILPISALFSASLLVLANLGYQSTGFNKFKWGTIVKFNKLNDRIHKFISAKSVSSRVKTAIILNNSQKCYNACGIKNLDSDLSWRIGASLLHKKQNHLKDAVINFETPKGREQAYCLTNCYLQWSLDQLEPLLTSYLTCLKSVGERGSDLSDMKLDLLTVPSSSICKPYYDLLKDHRSLYYDIVDFISQDSSDSEIFLRKYDDTINRVLSKSNKNINSDETPATLDTDEFKLNSDKFKSNSDKFKSKSNNNSHFDHNNKFNKFQKKG